MNARAFGAFGLAAALATGLMSAGCGDGGADDPVDAGPDAPPVDPIEGDEFTQIERTDDGPGAGTDGPDPATALGTRARLGRYRGGAALITGPEARCRQGDWILQNPHLTACISDGEPTDQMLFTAGRIIDLVPTSDPTGDVLDFIGPALGLLEAGMDELVIVRDGSDGGPAVLRSIGVDLPLKLLVGSLGTSILTPPIQVIVETEFRLEPDATAIEVVTWARLVGTRRAALSIGDIAFPGDLTLLWTWPRGFGSPGAGRALDWYAFVGRERSYGVWAERLVTPPLDPSLLSDSIFSASALTGQLGNQFEAAVRRWVTVGDGTTTSLREALADVIPDEDRVTVTIAGETHAGWPGGRWAIFDADSGEAIDIIRVDGTVNVSLPQGSLRAELIDGYWGELVEVLFDVPAAAPVDFPAQDAIPVTLSCRRGDAGSIAPACRVDTSGIITGTTFLRSGTTLPLPRGFTGTVRLSLGEASTTETLSIDDLQAPSTDTVTLERTLEATGWVAGDMHQHAMRSADSTVPSADRVLANLAAGLEFLAPSDHDVVENYPAVLEAMGLTGAIHVYQGVEISPVRGHINTFPMTYGPSNAGGAPALAVREGANERSTRQRDTNELLAEARALGARVAQINHGRAETSSLFDWVDYDPVTGDPRRNLADMPEQFEAMEIYNNASAVCLLMRDWFSFLRRGQRVVGFGNSDTHNLGTPSGWPRNYVHIGTAPLSSTSLTNAILAGRVTVSGGLMIDHGGAFLPGDTVTVPNGTTSFPVPVRVRSPEWAKADTLIVYVNGVEQVRIDLSDDTELEDLVDFDEDVDVTISGDSFVVVFAYSNTTMGVVTPGRRAFGFTNPVFIDVGNNGWTPPGVAAAADVPLPAGIPFCPTVAPTLGPLPRHLHADEYEAMIRDAWSGHEDHNHGH